MKRGSNDTADVTLVTKGMKHNMKKKTEKWAKVYFLKDNLCLHIFIYNYKESKKVIFSVTISWDTEESWLTAMAQWLLINIDSQT